MFNIGNAEIDPEDLCLLADYGRLSSDPDDGATLYLTFKPAAYQAGDLINIAILFARLKPDECELEGERLRLWWD